MSTQTQDPIDLVAEHLSELESAWLRLVQEAEKSARAASTKRAEDHK
jgi:hypothetical protein